MTITERESRKTVAEAAAMMDAWYPGWYERIDINKLDISDAARCIGAQLGVDWQDLNRDWQQQRQHGRVAYVAPFASRPATPFWREEVLARRLDAPVEAKLEMAVA